MHTFRTFIFILLLHSPIFALVDDANDKQFWCWQCLRIPIKKNWTFGIQGEERWGDDISKLFLYFVQFNLERRISDFLTIRPAYEKVWAKTIDFAIAASANVLLLDIVLTKKDNNFTLNNRNRTEYAMLEERKNLWLYRFRLELIYNRHCLKPYVSEELFFLEGAGFAQNRFIIGVCVPISKKNCLKLEYLHRTVEIQRSWRRHPIIGILLELTL